MIFEHESPTTFLQALFADGNSSQLGSLRAFCAKASVSTSFLSEVLNGKKKLSLESALKIGLQLSLTDMELQFFSLLVLRDREEDPTLIKEITRRLNALRPEGSRREMKTDRFRVIADWYHFAILELTALQGFQIEPTSVAERLKISPEEARAAIARLVRLKLLERTPRGYHKCETYVAIEAAVPDGAIKRFHRQILERASSALYDQTPVQRMSASDIIPIDSKHLPTVDRLSREFSNAIMKLSEKSLVRDHVYALSVHFFKLTQERAST